MPKRLGMPRPGCSCELLPRQLVGADVEAAPALGVGDEAGDRHRPLHHDRQLVAFGDVLPVARLGAADLLLGVEAEMRASSSSV